MATRISAETMRATRKKIQHIWRVHNSALLFKPRSIEINGRNIDYDSFTFGRRAIVFFKKREFTEYVVYETTAVPYDMIKEILVNGRRCIYD